MQYTPKDLLGIQLLSTNMIYKREVFFDVETKSFFDFESDNPRDPSTLGVSIVSVYSREINENHQEISGVMKSFWEKDFPAMWEIFGKADRIIGFNTIKFDVPALKPYAPTYFAKLPHFDILDEIKRTYGKRMSLNALAKDTLNEEKNDSGANAILYWEKGDPASLALLQKYCEMDVKLTAKLYDYGMKHKKLRFTDHWNTPREIEVDFSYPSAPPVSQTSLF
jgi:DEAD/DEAH box helicase domain-containing protein